ncbi:MAG: RNA 2',3'-cyclic phosphodiesterase [Candidatus Eisenbacteria bacterium]|nr:RNA 2',3'-cyclic phosphodiesterase [Candidatus Eisenbacteria bacterium]
MRLFLAVFPPPEAQAVAARASDSLRATRGGNSVSWVKRDNLHFTLRFLAEQDEAGMAAALSAAREAAKSQATFEVALSGLGAFPVPKRARVLWAGLEAGADAMRKLAIALDKSLAKHGFPAADHDFEPHLTLGRVRTPADWTERLVKTESPEVRFKVGKIVLVQSALAPGGSRYDVVGEALLGK